MALITTGCSSSRRSHIHWFVANHPAERYALAVDSPSVLVLWNPSVVDLSHYSGPSIHTTVPPVMPPSK